MSDIVEMLRHPKATQAEMEAAAEIERLRGDIQAPDGYTWEWHCQRKDEEIERLRGDISYLESQNSKTIHRAAVEIERLRGLLRDLRSCQEEQHGPEYIEMIADRIRDALGERDEQT